MNNNQATALHLWNLVHSKPISPVTPMLSTKLTRFLSEKHINLPPSVNRRVCIHCGVVSIPGLTTLVSIRYGSKKGINIVKHRMKTKKKATRSLVYSCLMCHKHDNIDESLINESVPIKEPIANTATSTTTPPLFKAKWTPPGKVETNSKSRERQKKRKQNSLTNLLANKKKNEKDKDRINSLNLMEFMK